MSTVLITGASRGIGRATAKAFADSGWDLLLLARSEEALARLVEEIDNKKVKVFYKSIDLINIRKNQGHTRCNATGIKYLSEKKDFDYLFSRSDKIEHVGNKINKASKAVNKRLDNESND